MPYASRTSAARFTSDSRRRSSRNSAFTCSASPSWHERATISRTNSKGVPGASAVSKRAEGASVSSASFRHARLPLREQRLG